MSNKMGNKLSILNRVRASVFVIDKMIINQGVSIRDYRK